MCALYASPTYQVQSRSGQNCLKLSVEDPFLTPVFKFSK